MDKQKRMDVIGVADARERVHPAECALAGRGERRREGACQRATAADDAEELADAKIFSISRYVVKNLI